MPHVEVSAGTVLTMLGMILLVVQPGAIPFTYAVATRHVRRGGTRPALVAVGAYLLGCVFTLVCVAAFFCSEFPMLWSLVLGYVPMWLFAVLILRHQPEAQPRGLHLRK
ncbi:hypothetical protein [Actinoplanes sp. L3-i22]|uniref:hypothetical protein n=1 Tax=Actinoplanes sp. L3-i22 TaxID=2836373 RepID=UPI001C74BE14|nr:hypothetical protein [Actinoplanes sp. L3-i22]BCY12635.1 hypothetical protein L3i22_077230 [Actinoplanes sp. L3-i22]